jgi:hypothetical protein
LTVTLALALLLQAVTVALLRHRLGRAWLRRPVVVLVLISVVTQARGAKCLTGRR